MRSPKKHTSLSSAMGLLAYAMSGRDIPGIDGPPMPKPPRELPPPLDVRAEVERILDGHTRCFGGWRHRVTGQRRYFEVTDRDVHVEQSPPDGKMWGKNFQRSFADTLQWLRNADPIGGQP